MDATGPTNIVGATVPTIGIIAKHND